MDRKNKIAVFLLKFHKNTAIFIVKNHNESGVDELIDFRIYF